ncbi:MAG: DUF255 domain-containing protein [Saprospiraceae bacterium]
MTTRYHQHLHLPLIVLLTLNAAVVFSQNLHSSKVQWTTFEQAEKMAKSTKSPKKIMVDLYRDNCGWCKKMDLSTFQNEYISHFMNENFYPIRFNAEDKKNITFNDNLFKFDKSGFHELAIALSLGDLGFPTLVFLDEENQIIQAIPGYKTVDELERIMYFFANDFYKSTPWNEFVQKYKATNSRPVLEPGDPMNNVEVIKKKN